MRGRVLFQEVDTSRSGHAHTTLLVTLLVTSGCGGTPGSANDSVACSTSEALIGGTDAPTLSYAAVGTLGSGTSVESFDVRCTATLIARDILLTAKHCILERPFGGPPHDNALSFGLGSSSGPPARVIPIVDIELLEPDTGGYTGFGSDLALCRLSTPVDDVAPIPVAHGSLGSTDLGARFTVVGFGTNLANGTTAALSVRRRGIQTLQALDGNLFDHIYGSKSAFMSSAGDDLFSTAACSGSAPDPAVLESEYAAATLLTGYEAWAGDGIGDAQACRGDSGGPLLREGSSGTEVVGVTSWAWHSRESACDHGSVYAIFGPLTADAFERWGIR